MHKQSPDKTVTQEIPKLSGYERILTDSAFGLTEEQVSMRKAQELANGEGDIKTKTVGRIIRDNIITPFNILNFILAGLVISVGSFKNVLFINIILINILIGCFQEIRAKKTIDRLSLISAPKAHVIRGGNALEISVSEIVLDDILTLSSGNQICADCTVTDGECEVNESLITGESDPVNKKAGDTLLSGSFVSSGSCHARVEHVGKENYASKISSSAKYVKKPNSEILYWMNIIIRIISIAIIPVGLLLFYKEVFVSGLPFRDSVVGVVAALIGMIPEGLMLLISVVFAVGVIRLSRHKTLVQELYCIETLARVDTLCLDKTGTITEGTMKLDEVIPLCGNSHESIDEALSCLLYAVPDSNPTSDALRVSYPAPGTWNCTDTVAFSSARKWSGASFEGSGTYLMGAGEFILGDAFAPYKELAEHYSDEGHRVLLLAHSKHAFQNKELPEAIEPIAFLLLSDKIRDSAAKTLEYFADQGVDIKIISGDNAHTVSNIARSVGLKNAEAFIDATTLLTDEAVTEAAEKYTVFGRVTPQQKLLLVKALKKGGHTVAMTGDGVNDVLALKESDCSIAMASGSDAARTVSQLVLMDSNFASMPAVVKEGRRSINNLQRSASLYLVKTIFSTILATAFIFLTSSYPFQPIQLTLISTFTIGAPSFILALEPNKERVKGKFIFNVLRKSLPAALTIAANILLLSAISPLAGFSDDQLSTLCVILTGFTGLVMLFRVCSPMNLIRGALFVLMVIGFVTPMIFFGWFFGLVAINYVMLIAMILMMLFAVSFMLTCMYLLEKLLSRHE